MGDDDTEGMADCRVLSSIVLSFWDGRVDLS